MGGLIYDIRYLKRHSTKLKISEFKKNKIGLSGVPLTQNETCSTLTSYSQGYSLIEDRLPVSINAESRRLPVSNDTESRQPPVWVIRIAAF